MTSTSTVTLSFNVTSQPSKSKGWGRYSVESLGLRSSTGNVWVYCNKTAEVESGTKFAIKVQGMNRTKSGREEVATTEVVLVAEEGATAEVVADSRPQRMVVTVTGARVDA